ncbi:MAG: hypothetical protein Q8S57_07010 [Methanoregula sp.]|nr:hypothetical protein [Methanoregula sp.]
MTGKNYRISCTAGVSESIGFLLIFTIVIAGIGLVTLYGYPMLLKQQTSADEQIMQKNMIVLQNDLKSLAYKTVPYKETSLKIGGGALMVYNSSYTPASSTIKIYDQNNIVYVNVFQSGDLLYSSDSAGTDISLQNGAVVKRQHAEQGSVMLAEPRWFYDSETKTMVINFVNLTSTGIMAKTGVGTVQMVLGEARFQKTDTPPLATPVYLEYTPDPVQDYSIAWNNYFTNPSLGMTLLSGTPGTGTMLKYQLPDTTTLVIKQYEVNIKSL